MNTAAPNCATHPPIILYVDDEALARKYFAQAFEGEFEVLTVAGADAAVAVLRDKPVGVVVTDYRMPGRNGADLLRQIEREFPSVVRVLVTAFAQREVLLDTVNSGEIFRILEKPLDLGEVRLVLRLACTLVRERAARQQKLMAMDETLAFLAHELNTPLAVINNFALGVQSRVGEDAQIGQAAQSIAQNATYCLGLLSSFVASVKGAGGLPACELGGMAQQMVVALLDSYPLTPVQRTAIRIEVIDDFAISVLPNCVALVLSSILSNALRAVREQAEPSIRFTLRVEGKPQICIADNGGGISPEVLQKLLIDPVNTYTDEGGHGWGMIFCQRIMQSFQGSIEVYSAPGEETRVTLNFPAAK